MPRWLNLANLFTALRLFLVPYVVIAILLKLSVPYVLQSYNIGEQSPDPGGLTHRWIVKSMLPIGFALLLVQSIAAMLRALIPILDPSAHVESATHTV